MKTQTLKKEAVIPNTFTIILIAIFIWFMSIQSVYALIVENIYSNHITRTILRYDISIPAYKIEKTELHFDNSIDHIPYTKKQIKEQSNQIKNKKANASNSNISIKNNTEYVDTSEFELLGEYKITGYTPKCEHCCGNTKGICANGSEAVCGYSVAAPKGIPFGTKLYIEGYGYYIVEDRGSFKGNTIDIACPTHEACYAITSKGINVYIVPNN